MNLSYEMLKLLDSHITSGGSIKTWLQKYSLTGKIDIINVKKQYESFKKGNKSKKREQYMQSVSKPEKELKNEVQKVEDTKEPELPSKVQQIKNLASFASDAAKELVSTGKVKSQAEIAEERYKICKSCPNFIHETERCRLCGCFMKTKVKYSAAKCPDKPVRWK